MVKEEELEVEKPFKAQRPAREGGCRKESEQRVEGPKSSQAGKLGLDLYAAGNRVHKRALKSKAAPGRLDQTVLYFMLSQALLLPVRALASCKGSFISVSQC